MSERLEIERPIHTRELEQRLDLGSKNEHARSHCNEQWFLAKVIPSQHEPLRVRIPERERKHAAKPVDRSKDSRRDRTR